MSLVIYYEHNLQVLHSGQHYRVWLSNYVNNDNVSLRLFWVYCIHENACKSCSYSFIKYVFGILYICNYFSVVYYCNVSAISSRISRLTVTVTMQWYYETSWHQWLRKIIHEFNTEYWFQIPSINQDMNPG